MKYSVIPPMVESFWKMSSIPRNDFTGVGSIWFRSTW